MNLFQRLVWAIRNRDDTVTLARLALATLDPNATGFAGCTEGQWKRIYFDCRKLREFKTLTAVTDDLKVTQRDIIVKSADAESLAFSRGVLVGIDTVAKRFKVLAEKANGIRQEEFNPNEVI